MEIFNRLVSQIINRIQNSFPFSMTTRHTHTHTHFVNPQEISLKIRDTKASLSWCKIIRAITSARGKVYVSIYAYICLYTLIKSVLTL